MTQDEWNKVQECIKYLLEYEKESLLGSFFSFKILNYKHNFEIISFSPKLYDPSDFSPIIKVRALLNNKTLLFTIKYKNEDFFNIKKQKKHIISKKSLILEKKQR